MGNLRAGLPITFWTFLIGTLSISGFPLLAGFFSKDEIIRAALSAAGSEFWLGVLALITAGRAASHMFPPLFLPPRSEAVFPGAHPPPQAPPPQTRPVGI